MCADVRLHACPRKLAWAGTATHGGMTSHTILLPAPPHRTPHQDEDPYVRKTAAVCVAKLYDINAELVEDRGFLDMLKVGRGC